MTLFRHGDDSDSRASRASHSWRRAFVDLSITLAVLAVVVTVVLLVQAFIVRPFRVPTASMANTIQKNERVLVDRVTFHFRDVRCGDIVVFKVPPAVSTAPLLKRVIGLPGETLSLRAGRVYVNGRLLSEPYLRQPDGSLTPTLPPPTYNKPAGWIPQPWSLDRPYTIPAGQYFVMGDNRTRSGDSRYWGTVPRSAIIGRVFAIYWPLDRVGWL